jgi:hypothetical protein
MKRVLYAVLILAMLAVPVSTAFADVPEVGDQVAYPFGPNFLGELVLVLAGGFTPFERVDAWLTRPATEDAFGNPVWPLTTYAPPVGPKGNLWWWPGDASEQRRWSFAETEGTVFERADFFGQWAAILMLPRDEVWYPCSFPFKWKCNYSPAPGVEVFHSPQRVVYDPGFGLLSFWPWLVFDLAADPQDTVSPLWMDVMNYDFPRVGVQWETVVDGYYWTPEDITQ